MDFDVELPDELYAELLSLAEAERNTIEEQFIIVIRRSLASALDGDTDLG